MSCIAFCIGRKMSKGGENTEKVQTLESKVAELTNHNQDLQTTVKEQSDSITKLTTERAIQETNAHNAANLLEELRKKNDDLRKEDARRHEKALAEKDDAHNSYIAELKHSHEVQINELKESNRKQIAELRESYDKQLQQVKESCEKQLSAIREMNKKQVEAQLNLIKEQMRTTSEDVLKARQTELGAQNKEQVSKIIDPLQKSLKDMQEAFNHSKEQQKEAITRLGEAIKLNMEKSTSLGETADRLTRALTGEVKVQGNFGELKLKQLLEDLELKEGEQFDTQESLKDKSGESAKGDDGKGLIPDFILHFPNNRHVVVDSKMSLTDYERYMNTEDGAPEKSEHLKAHIDSVRAQVKRLAKKDYTKYLPDGYNRLNFAIMYVPSKEHSTLPCSTMPPFGVKPTTKV